MELNVILRETVPMFMIIGILTPQAVLESIILFHHVDFVEQATTEEHALHMAQNVLDAAGLTILPMYAKQDNLHV